MLKRRERPVTPERVWRAALYLLRRYYHRGELPDGRVCYYREEFEVIPELGNRFFAALEPLLVLHCPKGPPAGAEDANLGGLYVWRPLP